MKIQESGKSSITVETTDRRAVLSTLLGGLIGAAVFRGSRAAETTATRDTAPDGRDHGYWQAVRSRFSIRPGLIMMNAANLAPSPGPVQEKLFEMIRDLESDVSHANRAKFKQQLQQVRFELAQDLGADADEIIITRNTTEGNNAVVSGIDFKPGDEVVIWDQNHQSNNIAWEVRAQRHGIKVVKVATPAQPHSIRDLLAPFEEAITGNTRMIAITHVSNLSGIKLPVQELCSLARERGIPSMVDGAQSFGAFPVNLHEIGCDYYTASGHKWFMGPKETGVFYVRGERSLRHWPAIVGVGWESAKHDPASRFGTLGQRNDAALAALLEASHFNRAIGRETAYRRIRALITALRREITSSFPRVEFLTPEEEGLSGGSLHFRPAGLDLHGLELRLYQQVGIACAVQTDAFPSIRLSPNIYNTLEECRKTIAAVKRLSPA